MLKFVDAVMRDRIARHATDERSILVCLEPSVYAAERGDEELGEWKARSSKTSL
jgi:hypothetical protein